MSNFEPNKRHLRELLIYFFNLKKSAAEAHRLLVETYGGAALNERSCLEWFQKFKNDEFNIEDKEHSGRSKVYEDAELEALLDQDSCEISVHRLRKIFAPTMDPTSSLRLPHSTNFWQWSEEETMSWWDPWWEQKSYAICEHCAKCKKNNTMDNTSNKYKVPFFYNKCPIFYKKRRKLICTPDNYILFYFHKYTYITSFCDLKQH